MNIKVHFFVTSVALLFLGIIAVRPGALHRVQGEESICRMTKGKMDCVVKNANYRINDMGQVPYSIN